MEDKRIRALLIAALVVVLVLGLLNIISTAFSLLVPLALVAIGGFAFYKIVLEGRDSNDVMEDEVAESAGVAIEEAADEEQADADDGDDSEARQRLSAVERAQSEFFDAATPAEEILDQIQTRKRRLTGKDEA
ncbi:MAG: hypothetical protein OXG53_16350 [Chloroflexi bacterium]|nr:hypothetical protein [Chloroflexota bacterium]